MSMRPYTPGRWMPMDTPTLVCAWAKLVAPERALATSAQATSGFIAFS